MSQAAINDIQTTLAAILKTSVKNVAGRLSGLKLGQTCSRCCGSGHYSFNLMTGSTCFGCNGSGVKPPKTIKQWQEVVTQAEHVRDNGTLDAYILRMAMQRKAKTWRSEALTEWKALPEQVKDRAAKHHWTKQSQLCAATNSICSPAFDKISKLGTEASDGIWDKAARKYVPATTERLLEISAEVETLKTTIRNAEQTAREGGARDDIQSLSNF